MELWGGGVWGVFFFFNDTATTEIYTLSLHDVFRSGKAVSASPEYEDCRKIALESGISLQDVYQQAMAEARRQYLD